MVYLHAEILAGSGHDTCFPMSGQRKASREPKTSADEFFSMGKPAALQLSRWPTGWCVNSGTASNV